MQVDIAVRAFPLPVFPAQAHQPMLGVVPQVNGKPPLLDSLRPPRSVISPFQSLFTLFGLQQFASGAVAVNRGRFIARRLSGFALQCPTHRVMLKLHKRRCRWVVLPGLAHNDGV